MPCWGKIIHNFSDNSTFNCKYWLYLAYTNIITTKRTAKLYKIKMATVEVTLKQHTRIITRPQNCGYEL